MRDLEATAFAFDRAAGAAGVPYAVVGGFAVSAWGQTRTTADVDALVDLDPTQVNAFASALDGEDLRVSVQDLRDVLQEGGHVTIFDRTSSFHIDAKLCRRSDEREQVAHAVKLRFDGGDLRVARAEDTIAYKLAYASPQDVADAASILARQGKALDEKRLMTLAIRLNVVPALRKLQDDVERARGR